MASYGRATSYLGETEDLKLSINWNDRSMIFKAQKQYFMYRIVQSAKIIARFKVKIQRPLGFHIDC